MVLDLSGIDLGVCADLAYADRFVAVRAEEDPASVPQARPWSPAIEVAQFGPSA
jgi:hypothetical protein